jgi:hypothetical protein
MIVCPVCEHAQAHGGECELCGKRLAGPPPPAPGGDRLEGLEPTGHDARSIPVPPDAVPGLEPTGHAAVAPPLEAVPELEATAARPVDVDAARIADLEPTEAAGLPGDGPTPLPAFPTCRYCRTPALPGERVCARCGMRLPVAAAAAEPHREPAARLCSCGAPLRGPVCPACGARASAGS